MGFGQVAQLASAAAQPVTDRLRGVRGPFVQHVGAGAQPGLPFAGPLNQMAVNVQLATIGWMEDRLKGTYAPLYLLAGAPGTARRHCYRTCCRRRTGWS